MNPTRENLSHEGAGIVDDIFRLFEIGRRRGYSLDGVSHSEHAVQAVLLAEEQGEPQSLVVAALVHDIGHFLEPWPRDIAHLGTDHQHEELGSVWLARAFGPEVSEPVRLHVAAKRYLCTTDDDYIDSLSLSSPLSLEVQGGPMNRAEVQRFEGERYFQEAVRLRRIDDAAKLPCPKLPDIREYRCWLESMLPYYARG